MVKRVLVTLLVLLLYSDTFAGHRVIAASPDVSAQAAILMDVASGRVLYEKNADEKKPIASITKIMTAIIAIEHGHLDDMVTISREAARMEGSSIYLKEGEKMKLHHLLYGLMLRSGNDAAVAIAEHIGGSVEGFAVLMNEKAQYLGMTNSHFVNPSGLDAKDHYSTARDMAKLTVYALRNDVFKAIVATKAIQVPNPGEKWDRKWYNKNKMLHFYAGADGVKTGYTSRAKRTLVSSATRNGQQLLTVTLNAPDDWNDSTALLDYGFNVFPSRTVVPKGKVLKTVTVDEQPFNIVAEQTFSYPLSEEERRQLEQKMKTDIKKHEMAEGRTVGRAVVYLNDKAIGSVPLTVKKSRKETGAILKEWLNLMTPVWNEVKP